MIRKTFATVALLGVLVWPLAAQTPAPPSAKEVAGRVIVEGGGTAPRFALQVSGAGRAVASIEINPAADGSFRVSLPLGLSLVGTSTGLPAGYTVQSITYGAANLLQDPLMVASTDAAQIAVTLRAPPLVRVSGRVTGLASTVGVLVALNGTPFETLIKADGTFILNNVPPGSYQVRVISGNVGRQTAITVAGADVADVVIAMPQEHWVTGLVIVEGLNGPTPAVTAEAKASNGQVVVSSIPTAYDGTNTGQFFTLRLRDGEYNFSIRSVSPAYQVQSAHYGVVDLLKAPLKLDGLADWNIVVRLVPVSR